MAFKNPIDLANQLVKEGMKPGTPVNAPSHSVWVQDDDGTWKLYSGRDGAEGFNRFSPRFDNYKNAIVTRNGEDVETTFKGMDDYDLFNAIHYTPTDKDRPNYLVGEEEQIWNELNKYFDLPKYEANKYDFAVNPKDRIVNLSTRGEQDGRGFGGWKVKPESLGALKRRQ